MWYETNPSAYAAWLRLRADCSEASAARVLAEDKPWSEYEAKYFRLQSRRLRAMALLCDRSTANRAGGIDFMGLSDPSLSREQEDAVIKRIEAGV